MKKIVGIISRPGLDISVGIQKVKNIIKDRVLELGLIPLSIMPTTTTNYLENSYHYQGKSNLNIEDFNQLLDLCDGFILQGGTYGYDYEIEVIKHAHRNNKPILGICMGMQNMGVYLGGNIDYINGIEHKSEKEYVHDIDIKEDSQLYSITNELKIKVNSRHIEKVVDIDEKYIVARHDDIIEAVEDKSRKFFIGVQWHPEDLKDEASLKIFKSFCKKVKENL